VETDVAHPVTARSGDARQAVTALYQAHALGLIRLALIMLGDRPSAEDVVQDAFCGLYRRWRTLSDTDKALAYVRSSVLNGSRTALRRRARASASGSPSDPLAESAESAAMVSEEHREVLAAIRQLPDRQREALVLRYYLDLREEEIATAMGISRGTVKSTTRVPRVAWWPRSRWPRSRWLLPVAAATAVAVIALGGLAIGRSLQGTGRAGAPAGTAPAGSPVAGPPASWYVSSGRAPRYYVELEANGAVIRATATGKLIGTVKAAPGYAPLSATAAADDRTFVLVETRWQKTSESVLFYRLRLDSAGTLASLTRLSIPAGQLVTTAPALSPDGMKLAIAVHLGLTLTEQDETELRVYNLATGAVKTWTGRGVIGGVPDEATMSWTADDSHLTFDWDGAPAGIRLLNTATGGGSLLRDSRLVLSTSIYVMTEPTPVNTSTPNPSGSGIPVIPGQPLPVGIPDCGDTIVTPDGSALVCGIATYTPVTRDTGNSDTEFLEFSTATGKVTHILGRWALKDVGVGNEDSVLWSSPSGSVLIGVIPGRDSARIGIIKGNTFTPLTVPDDPYLNFGLSW
jgi:RNA polymerase sigma-70 factor (sigma-E family)